MKKITLKAPAKRIALTLSIALIGTFTLLQNPFKKTELPTNEATQENSEDYSDTKPDTSRDHEGDTFSIVAYDKTTGQVGGAACSCVTWSGGIDFLSDLITDGTTNSDNIVGAIHSQAAYNASTQTFARNRMLAGDTPQQIINATVAADGSSASRQYGVVGVDSPGAAGFSGTSNGDYKNDQQGDNALYTYSIQGNILDATNGQDLLDDMETIFNSTSGTLGDKLMAALQAAKRVGGDSRCQVDGNSGRTAFIQVLSPGETSPGLIYDIGDTQSAVADFIEPIDILQCLYDAGENTPFCRQTVNTFPYSMDFEEKSWEQDVSTCSVNSSWIRSRFATPSSGTGPTGANEGTLYTFVEASNVGGQGTAPRSAIIGSPCFEIPAAHTASMTFDYHMVGNSMGTLSIEASNNGGSSWTTLWSKTGAQGSTWNDDEPVDLSLYSGSTVKIRVNALLGNGFASDMAIDDIQINVQPILACSGPTKTWNGNSWSPSGAPDLTNPVIIDGNYNTSTGANGSFEACTVTVNTSATLTVGADSYILVDTDITVDGTLLVEHTGNVVQTDDSAAVTKGSSGVINVKLTTPVLQTRDFMVMGSPMDAETRNDVFTDAFLVLNHNTSNFVPDATVPSVHGVNFADASGTFWQSYNGGINLGEGYIVRPQEGYSDPANESYDMTYTQGTLNNGEYIRNISLNGSSDDTPNIYANPYPSAMSAFEFINQNPLVTEVYFWEHLTPPSTSIPGYNSINFSMRDISMYNMGGGTKAPNDSGNSTEPNGVISTGQGFAIMGSLSGQVTMNNSMRLTSGNTTLRTPNEEELDKIWLQVASVQYEVTSSTLLGFNPEATEGIDRGYDSRRLYDIISIFSTLPDSQTELGIQTTSAFDASKKFPIGFSTEIEGTSEYEISISKTLGARIENARVFLYDTEEDITVELTSTNYTFKSNAKQSPERFTLFFMADDVLGSEDRQTEEIAIFPNPANDVINIISVQEPFDRVEIYDLRGRLVQEEVGNNTSTAVNISTLQSGVYIVRVSLGQTTVTKKLVKK